MQTNQPNPAQQAYDRELIHDMLGKYADLLETPGVDQAGHYHASSIDEQMQLLEAADHHEARTVAARELTAAQGVPRVTPEQWKELGRIEAAVEYSERESKRRNERLATLSQPIEPQGAVGAGEWLPIESAPKDGTPILAWSHGHGARETRWEFYGVGSQAREKYERGEGPSGAWGWHEPMHNWASSWNPTHWQPLPSAPGTEPTRAQEGFVLAPVEPPFPKEFLAMGIRTENGVSKTVYLDWTDEGGGWHQWATHKAHAKQFKSEKAALDAAKYCPGPIYNMPAKESIAVIQVEGSKVKQYRAMIDAAIAAAPRGGDNIKHNEEK